MSTPPEGGRTEIPTDSELDVRSKLILVTGKRIDLQLRVVFAVAFLFLVLVQIGIVDRFLWVYAQHQKWDVPTEVIIAFISATVVEVLGVVAIIVRYLFDHEQT